MSEQRHAVKELMDSKGFQAVVVIVRMALGIMFTYAGLTKIIAPAGFALAVYNYHILPAPLVNITAIVLPWVEVIAGTCLVLGLWIPGGALIVSGLLFVFAIALGFNLARGLDVACGCFSSSPTAEKITWWYLLRDGSLLVAALGVLFYDRGLFALQKRVISSSSKTG
ncbi:MAG TPA: MauE/DoxX family redox-associated membrane protein [Deltaproteobacteria bacterium]|nr:MauE/DoxX family redox-associated membrane protein [Deltaproteobacteria bacterium]HNS91073.1 MauE/DoxX family redox-associated membrane protein [Deltaproteobacteria bacterium]HOD72151.1 MauE/DoxX family redox-associated membrane protein [Deltaproteobacteria bacterium]HPA76484.1 MauE/DoxX family redox-associated membrane protein [Deltaproteobacteria bacterium]